MRQLIHSAASLVLLSGVAFADHHGMVMPSNDNASDSSFDASVSLVAATFSPSQSDMMDYGGNYQGVVPALGWTMDRYAAGASWAYYRVLRNGQSTYGVGDLVVHAQVAVLRNHTAQAGALLAVSAPTGDDIYGLGMGHPMLMPAMWGAWRHDELVLTASLGYSRAAADLGAHIHGMAPLVEPMNMSEVTWSTAGEYALGGGVHAGVRVSGGVPVAITSGVDRVVGAARVAWGEGRVDTAAELQAGLAGDPFNFRAVLSTALRF